MTQSISEVMAPHPVTIEHDHPILEAARLMRDHDIGDVVVTENGAVIGILTDRDIVVRGLAAREGALDITVGEICSADVVSLSPEDDVDEAIQLMGERHLRRLPITVDRKIVGIVTLGDLAMQREPGSVLSEISAAPPDA